MAAVTPIFSLAPMMDYTDRYCRYMMRLVAPHVRLYTEMLTTQAILRGDRDYLLGYDDKEKPLALQLGGADPTQLKLCAKIGEDYGYNEINLNVGCPSSRVKAAKFGACLMLEPQLVAECVAAMQSVVNIPVTVKCRIGVDEVATLDSLIHFISMVAGSCQTFIIHARKAWLSGLSPKENREIPPLDYEVVYQIKKIFPHLTIILNGGLKKIDEVKKAIQLLDGVMIGRAAYDNPCFLAEIEKLFYKDSLILSREEIIAELLPYIDNKMQRNIPFSHISRHLLNLFHGEKGAKIWRRYLSEHAHQKYASIETLQSALTLIKSYQI